MPSGQGPDGINQRRTIASIGGAATEAVLIFVPSQKTAGSASMCSWITRAMGGVPIRPVIAVLDQPFRHAFREFTAVKGQADMPRICSIDVNDHR